jgi:hypothetical protein
MQKLRTHTSAFGLASFGEGQQGVDDLAAKLRQKNT